MHLQLYVKERRAENWDCVDLKLHISGKVMDEDYTIPDIETIFHNPHGASYFEKKWLLRHLSNCTWRRCKRHIHNQGLFVMCRKPKGWGKLFFNLPELHRINTQRNQRCCDLSERCVGLWNNPGAVRQGNAWSQELATWERLNFYWEKI